MLRGTMLIALVLALVAPAAASASTKPAVTTGAAANVADTSVTLTGKVDPNGAATVYFFQYGPTIAYGTNTAETSIGSGTRAKAVALLVAGLTPNKRYHYRLVARNRHGTTLGADRRFKTARQPRSFTLGASPAAVAPGGATTLVGTLAGTGNANQQVQLESSAWPFLTGFAASGSPVVTDAAGNFAIPVLSLAVTTQFRVKLVSKPQIMSGIVVVPVVVQVTTNKKTVKRFRHSVRVRFFGSITPAIDGSRVDIQKLRRGVWTTIAHTVARDAGDARSRYRATVRIRRSGSFRVVAEYAGAVATGAGREIFVRAPR